MIDREVLEFYEEGVTDYDRRWLGPGGTATLISQNRIVLELCQEWRGKEILEAGCGTGRFSPFLMEIGNETIFVDLSLGMLKATRRRLQQNSSVLFSGINASIYNLPVGADTFDCVLSVNVFNHLRMPGVALHELARVLKPGGQLVVNFANRHSYYWPAALLVTWRQRSIGRDVYSSWLTAREIESYFKDAGFRVNRVVGNVHVPLYLDRPVIRTVLCLLDSMSRDSILRPLAPSLFFACKRCAETQ